MTRSRSSSFWLVQLAWWGSCAVVFHLASLPRVDDASLHGQLINLGQKLAKAGAGFTASLVLYALCLRPALRLPLPVLGVCAAAGSIVLGTLWEVATRAVYLRPLVDDRLLRDAMLPGFVLAAWSGLHISLAYSARAAEATSHAQRAQALATEAELAMLRYQVNPHFLFNALNSLRALIDENPAAARGMVTQLAELFRYTLRTSHGELTVGDELAAIRYYLDIQKLRFDDELDAAIESDAAAEATALAGFLIHPLVENAVKYGRETSPSPLRVRVRARRIGNQFDVVVSNTGRWLDDGAIAGGATGTGTGLRNLRARLAHLYPGRHAFAITADGGEVRARLTLEVAP